MDKRAFIKTTAALSIGSLLSAGSMRGSAAPLDAVGFDESSDDNFWRSVRAGYTLPKDFTNLENGFYCVQPDQILEKYIGHIRDLNIEGAHYLRTAQPEDRKKVGALLAGLVGCGTDELMLTRNTTESLDLVIGGLNWKKGDEAVMAVQDYGAMIAMFGQVAARYGVTLKKVNIPFHPASDEEIVDVYERTLTTKSRLLMVSHIVNITGQVLPVRKICDMAHKRGVMVMVDGAHAVAHLEFKIPDLNCDFYGSSLHKWLSVPVGAGMLYLKKEHINNLWPLFAEVDPPPGIARLNHIGTHPAATDLAIADAIAYYRQLGAARKEERLRYLQRYWAERVRNMRHVTMFTPHEAARTCAIATFAVKGKTPHELAAYLMNLHRIYTVAIDKQGVNGCRVTPNVYTTTDDLDRLVAAVEQAKD